MTNLESNRIYSSWSILWHTCWNSWSKFSLTITHNALLSLSKLDQALSCLIFHGLWQIGSQISLPDLYGTPIPCIDSPNWQIIPWIVTNLESNRIYSSWSILWHTCWNSWSKFSLTITHNALLSLSKLDQALSCLIFHGLWQIGSQIASTLPDLSYGTPVGTVEVSFHSQLPTMHCYPSPNLTKLFLA